MLAAKSMGIASLSDANLALVESSHLEDVARRRAIHVNGESDRVFRERSKALRSNQDSRRDLLADTDRIFQRRTNSGVNAQPSSHFRNSDRKSALQGFVTMI
jgi:hypothetical protein